MIYRAENSGISLSEEEAALIKGMLSRGDRQHDIAAWFSVNGGRIGEISRENRFRHVRPASPDQLPPPGPYMIGKRSQQIAEQLKWSMRLLDLGKKDEAKQTLTHVLHLIRG